MKLYSGKNKGHIYHTYVNETSAGGIIKAIKKQSKKDVLREIGIRRLD